jgi:thiol-disulfide isomerase/thioredoxin
VTTRAQRSRGMPRRATVVEKPSTRMPILIVAAVAAVLLVAAVAAIALSGSSPASSLAEPARSPLSISGGALPVFTDATSDAAIGQAVPTLSGIGIDGSPLSIGPSDGPMAIVVLAHWCSYCQAEVPELVSFIGASGMPEGVEIVALTTSIDPARPNYPPSAWFQRERWTVPTLIDDASNRGLSALGMTSFPAFVFVDGDGRVVHRHAGALGADAFGEIVERLAR